MRIFSQDVKGENKAYRQGGEIEGNTLVRLTEKELNEIVEGAGFKSEKENLDWPRYEIQCFEPFPGGEAVQDFREWGKSRRRQMLITVEEESEDRRERNDSAEIKRDNSEQIDAELNPFIKLMTLPVVYVWENFENQKPKLWFVDEKKNCHASGNKENWLPVVWEAEKEEEGRELFVEHEPTSTKKRNWFSRKFLRRHGYTNKKPKTPGFFSRLFLRCFH